MNTRLEQVLERCLGGRTIAIWGNPTRALLRALRGFSYQIAGSVDPTRHYVVAVNDDDLADFLRDEQSPPFRYVDDYLTFCDVGGELPFPWECFGARIGRQTYFGESVASACEEGYVRSIGHFTSINGSAQIAANHQLDMLFLSDDIRRFFSEENAALFQRRLASDPRHPYALGKPAMTIGSDVYIGANAFINASRVTRIGDGAVIGAGAVVLEDVPPYAVVVGVPARVKRYRFPPDKIELLLRVKWWEWPAEKIDENAESLFSPGLFFERYAARANEQTETPPCGGTEK